MVTLYKLFLCVTSMSLEEKENIYYVSVQSCVQSLPFLCLFFSTLSHEDILAHCNALLFHMCPSNHHLIHSSLRTFKFLSALAKLLWGWLVVLSLSPIKALQCRMSASSKSFVRHGFTPRASQKEPLLNRAAAEWTELAPTSFWNSALRLNILYFFGWSLFLLGAELRLNSRRQPRSIASNLNP